MSDTLVIRLPTPRATASSAQWLLVDAIGGRLGVVLQGSVAEAAALSIGRKTVVVVPGIDVLSTEATLPLRRAAHLEQMVRYALEDQLASDIDDMHFAIGKRGAGGSTPVAVVAHVRMQECLAQLAEAGIVPDAIYTENDLVPAIAGGRAIVIDDRMMWVRTGSAHATALDAEPLSDALQLAIAGVVESAGETTIYVSQSDYDRDGSTIEGCREKLPDLQVKLLPEGPLPLFALQIADGAPVNLLTGPYAKKKSWDKAFAPWRIAAALCGVALFLFFTTFGVRYWQLKGVERQLDQQIGELVAQTLPNAASKDPRNARRQFEAALKSAQGSGGAGALLNGLHVLSNTIQQVPDTRIDALAFRAQTIDIRVTAPSVDALDRIQHLASEQGYAAEIQSAQPRDNKVEGRMQLKTPEA